MVLCHKDPFIFCDNLSFITDTDSEPQPSAYCFLCCQNGAKILKEFSLKKFLLRIFSKEISFKDFLWRIWFSCSVKIQFLFCLVCRNLFFYAKIRIFNSILSQLFRLCNVKMTDFTRKEKIICLKCKKCGRFFDNSDKPLDRIIIFVVNYIKL